MPGFFIDYWYIVLVLPAIILAAIASINVKLTFHRYNKVKVGTGVDSIFVVKRILSDHGIHDVSINTVRGELTDHYNPMNKTLNLSSATSGKDTISAIGVAAHEAGHAVQFAQNYFFVKLRSAMVPVVNIGSNLGWILIMIGFLLSSQSSMLIIQLGIALYSLTFLFTLITLPVELDASRRAVAILDHMGEFSKEEIKGVKKVLTAAAMTYVASMIVALASLLRFILAASHNSRNRR